MRISLLFYSLLFILFYYFVLNTLPFLYNGNFPESILEYTSGLNFKKYGFLNSGFILDYSSSADPLDHPYFYTHQIGLPGIILGILFNFNFTILETRLIFFFISISGLFYFKLILDKYVNKNNELFNTIIIFIFIIGYKQSIIFLDHYTHSFYYLCYFGSIYYYLEYIKTNLIKYKIATYFIFFIAISTSILCATSLFVAIYFISYINAKVKRDIPYLFFVGVFLFLIILLRNSFILGFNVASLELIYTLFNRIIGIPSRIELLTFFNDNNIVLWGVEKFNSSFFLWLGQILISPFIYSNFIFLSFTFCVFLNYHKLILKNVNLKLLTIITFSVFAWHFIFLAQGSIYIWRFLDKFIYIYIMFITIKTNIYFIYNYNSCIINLFGGYRFSKSIFLIYLFSVFLTIVSYSINILGIKNFIEILSNRQPLISFELDSDNINQNTVISNIDGIVASFLIKNSIVYGSCSLFSIENIQTENCPSTFLRKRNNVTPHYIFLTTNFIPGSNKCTRVCIESLSHSMVRSDKFLLIKDISFDNHTYQLFKVNLK